MRKYNASPTDEEILQFEALHNLGISYWEISRRLNRSVHTVKKYLMSPKAIKNPETREMIRLIREKEKDDLLLLGVKARKRLHELLDQGKTKVIETTVIMDKSFQQRRLLENASTANIQVESWEEYVFRIRREKELDPPDSYPITITTTAYREQENENKKGCYPDKGAGGGTAYTPNNTTNKTTATLIRILNKEDSGNYESRT